MIFLHFLHKVSLRIGHLPVIYIHTKLYESNNYLNTLIRLFYYLKLLTLCIKLLFFSIYSCFIANKSVTIRVYDFVIETLLSIT